MVKPSLKAIPAQSHEAGRAAVETNLATFRSQLRQALLAGDDTSPIRAKIAPLEVSLQTMIATEAELRERNHTAQRQIEAEAVRALAEALIDEAEARQAEALAEIAVPDFPLH